MSSAVRRAVIVREWSWRLLVPRLLLATFRLSCALARPAEIASQHGMEVTAVERFEAPVQAEKDYALTRARAVRIGDGGPTMGDLVLDRLAGARRRPIVSGMDRDARGRGSPGRSS